MGSNSAYGFFSCYEHLASPDTGDFLWVIKGGAGCGKSTFMKKIAAEAVRQGFQVEYIYCSGDPDSLDGIYIPELHIGYTDGTSPHVQEPPFPASRGAYLDLGQFYDIPSLMEHYEEIKSATTAYKTAYAQAYDALKNLNKPTLLQKPEFGKKRFLKTLTCQGWVQKKDTANHHIAIRELREILASDECPQIIYLHPLWPDLLYGIQLDGADYVLDIEMPDCNKATEWLVDAKKHHDALEKIYYPYVDFDALNLFTEKHMEKYL